jgi:hypothetical protein
MNSSPEILNELKAISPLLAGLEKINVFQVPDGYFNELHLRIADYAMLNNTSAVDNTNKRNLQQVPPGYFDTLSDSILAKVKAAYPESAEEELRGFPVLYSLKSNVFSVPDGYFESLAGHIIAKLKQQAVNSESAEEELLWLSPMLCALRGNVFLVPDGYFESLAGDVVNKLKLRAANSETAEEELSILSPMLYALKGENVFSVPDGYFKSLAEDVVNRLKPQSTNSQTAEEELRRLSPLLFSLKGNVFSVPDGYFECLAEDVVKRLKPQPAKIVALKKRNSWLRYAAAAVVTGAIIISSLQIFNSSHDLSTSVVAGLPDYVKASFQYKTEDALNAGIAKLSDDDIAKYLEKSGNIMDNELLTNNTDVSEMPSQADYLSDDNTLNTYLDKIDADAADKSKP